MYNHKIRELHKRLLRLERVASQSEEGRFFDNPLVRSVREFAESEAISNDIEVSENASEALESEKPKELIKSEAIVAPPTPTEIKKKPGGDEFSTLNQFVLKTEEDVRMPAPESAEKPPESLEEGKKDIAQKAEDREVSKSEKLRAIRRVMKKESSSGYWLLTQQRRIQKEKEESRSKKRRYDDDDELTDSDLEIQREIRRYEEESARRKEERKQKEQAKEKRKKELEQHRKDRAKARAEAKVKKIRDMAEKAERYSEMKGQEKSQFTRQVYKMMGSGKNNLMFKLRKIKDPEEKGKELARALKSLEGK